jgi:hypothetical protein
LSTLLFFSFNLKGFFSFVFFLLCIEDCGSFVICRATSVRFKHLCDQNFDHDLIARLLCAFAPEFPLPDLSGLGPWPILLRQCPKEIPVTRPLLLCGLALCVLGPPRLCGQAYPTPAESRSNPALEQFKSLAGEWEGKDSGKNAVSVSYEVLASGVVMERLQPAGQPGMLTMYSLDGDHIVAIHFCSAGNQPVMKTGPLSAATGKYDFSIERVYGLNTPEELHMVALLMTLTDKDHITQAWTKLNHGERSTNIITLTRKK